METKSKHRTTADLQKHLYRCNSCRNTISFCYRQPTVNNLEIIKTFFHCNSYFCETCASRKKRQLEKKIKYLKINGRLRFLTLTLDTKLYTPEKSVEVISSLFNDFCHRLRDRGFKFQFFKIIELTKNNIAHLHVLINCYIDVDVVREVWLKCSGSYIVHIEEIQTRLKACEYLVKYMNKAINSFANYLFYLLKRRRYSYSINFFIEHIEPEKFIKTFIHFFNESEFLELLNRFIRRRFFNSKLMKVDILNHWEDYKLSYS